MAAVAAGAIVIFGSAIILSSRLGGVAGPGAEQQEIPATPIEIAALGKTPSQLNRLHGDLSVALGPMGEKTATFTTPAGQHTVWFVGQAGSERAFLVRLDRRMALPSQQDLGSYLGRWLGAPAQVDCHAGRRDACRFSWSLGDSVTVRAESAIAPSPEPGIEVTMLALDTRMRDAPPADTRRQAFSRAGTTYVPPACGGQKHNNNVFYNLACGRVALRGH